MKNSPLLKIAMFMLICFCLLTIRASAEAIYPMYNEYSHSTDSCGYDWTTTTTYWSDGSTTSRTELAAYECRVCLLMGMCGIS